MTTLSDFTSELSDTLTWSQDVEWQRKNETSKNAAYNLPSKADGGLSVGLIKTMVELTITIDKQQKKRV